jgi:hypothetical protein
VNIHAEIEKMFRAGHLSRQLTITLSNMALNADNHRPLIIFLSEIRKQAKNENVSIKLN